MAITGRKQAVSVRIGVSDLRRLKRLGERLGARDSDIIRFAVKTMLANLAPLCDPDIRGRRLLPMFANDLANEFLQHFDLDSSHLNDVLNAGTDDNSRVDMEDIQLIAMTGLRRGYETAPRAQPAPSAQTELQQTIPQTTNVAMVRQFSANAVVAAIAHPKK